MYCADRIARGDKDGWHLDGWCDDLRRLLKEVMGSGNQTARETGLLLIDFLGRRGHLDFGELLNPSAGQSSQ